MTKKIEMVLRSYIEGQPKYWVDYAKKMRAPLPYWGELEHAFVERHPESILNYSLTENGHRGTWVPLEGAKTENSIPLENATTFSLDEMEEAKVMIEELSHEQR